MTCVYHALNMSSVVTHDKTSLHQPLQRVNTKTKVTNIVHTNKSCISNRMCEVIPSQFLYSMNKPS
jgi:hypothetical protein